MLFWFTASDPSAKSHYEKTVENKVDLRKMSSIISKKDVDELRNRNLFGNVNMWGAVSGKSNKKNWEEMNEGDYVFGYQKGVFKHFGEVKFKLHNRDLAQNIWGTNSEGETWEYIYIFEILKEFSFPSENFSTLFKYKPNYHPQGFSHPSEERMDYVIQRFGGILQGISYYNGIDMEVDHQKVEQEFTELVEKNIKKGITLDSNDDLPKKPKKSKKTTKKKKEKYYINRDSAITAKALKRANYKCEYNQDHFSYMTTQEKMFTEGHHLIPMQYYQDFSIRDVSIDHIANVVSLCPNCHSRIHHGNDADRRKMIKKLFADRKSRLEDAEIDVTLEDFYLYYDLKG